MKTIKTLLLAISFIVLFSCVKDESDGLYLLSDNYRLTKILNYSSTSDSDPNTFVNLEYDGDGNLKKESLFDYPNTLFTFREFDYENGLLKIKKIYDGQVGNLKLGTYHRYEYVDGKLVKEELFLGDGTLKYTEHHEYIGDNLVNTYKISDELGIHHQYKYTYNDLNLLVLEESYMYEQQLEGSTKYFYDEIDRLTRTEIFNFEGMLIHTEQQKYDGDSEIPAETMYYDPDGKLSQQQQFIYDEFENLIEIKITDSQGTHTLFKKKYNGKLLMEYIRYAPNWGYSEWSVTRYEYTEIK